MYCTLKPDTVSAMASVMLGTGCYPTSRPPESVIRNYGMITEMNSVITVGFSMSGADISILFPDCTTLLSNVLRVVIAC